MSFDTLAPHYRWMEFVLAGEKLQRCRAAFLHDIPPARNILLLGEGHGRFLLPCSKRFPGARISLVDGSEAMLAQARRRWVKGGCSTNRVTYLHSDLLDWTPPPKEEYDLIVTHFVLDCFRPEQLERIIRVVGDASTKNATWLLSDFQLAAKGMRRFRSRVILQIMYLFFRATTRLPAHELTPPGPFLRSAGFSLRRSVHSEWGLLHSDWWQRQG